MLSLTGLSGLSGIIGPGTPPLSVLFYDTFTGTDGTLLSVHTPETGGPWVSSFGTWDIGGNKSRLFTNGGGDSCNVAQVDVGVADVVISTSWEIGNVNGYFGNTFNYASMTDFWSWRYYPVTGDLWLYKRVSGTDSIVVSVSGLTTYSGGDLVSTVLATTGDTVTLSINGTQRINSTTAGRPGKTATRHGLFNFIVQAGAADTLTIMG